MIITKELPYAKEVGDVMVLLASVTKTIKNKGDYMALMPQLVAAVDGVSDIDDEFKANPAVVEATCGYHLGEIAGALTAKAQA